MLKRTLDGLKFTLENIYTSTHAVGVSMVDNEGNLLGECGDIDASLVADAISIISVRSRQVYDFLNGSKDEHFCLYSQGTKGSFVVYSVSKYIFIVMFFPTSVNIFSIKGELDGIVSRVRELISDVRSKASCPS